MYVQVGGNCVAQQYKSPQQDEHPSLQALCHESLGSLGAQWLLEREAQHGECARLQGADAGNSEQLLSRS